METRENLISIAQRTNEELNCIINTLSSIYTRQTEPGASAQCEAVASSVSITELRSLLTDISRQVNLISETIIEIRDAIGNN